MQGARSGALPASRSVDSTEQDTPGASADLGHVLLARSRPHAGRSYRVYGWKRSSCTDIQGSLGRSQFAEP